VSFRGKIVESRTDSRAAAWQTILDSDTPVTLIGGGPCDAALLEQALTLAPTLVAADGGADRALALGHMPRAVIGDLDSLSQQARTRLPAAALHRISEQDTTDFDKALRSIKAPAVIGVGFLGGRMDHSLAALSVLVMRPGPPCLLLGDEDVALHCPPVLELDLEAGSRFSLYPLARITARSTGLRWPLEDLTLAPDGRIGTSNEVTGKLRLEVDGAGLIALMPLAALAAALDAVLRAPPHVPARR
jgi:thiamine pyrophosphokinase